MRLNHLLREKIRHGAGVICGWGLFFVVVVGYHFEADELDFSGSFLQYGEDEIVDAECLALFRQFFEVKQQKTGECLIVVVLWNIEVVLLVDVFYLEASCEFIHIVRYLARH